MRRLHQDQDLSSRDLLARRGHRDSNSSKALPVQDSSLTTLHLHRAAGQALLLHSLVARCRARLHRSLMDNRDHLREELHHIFSRTEMLDRTQGPLGQEALHHPTVHLALQVLMASPNKEDILNSSNRRLLKPRSSVLTRPRSLVLLSRPSVCSMLRVATQ